VKLVLYLNGSEGFFTLKIALQAAQVQCIVLPEGGGNTEIRQLAEQENIPVTERSLKGRADISSYTECTLISSAFPYKVYSEERDVVAQAINIHAALLPKYRGRHGGVWAMINDEPVLGVTIHDMDDGFDSGSIQGVQTFDVNDRMRLCDIQEAMCHAHKNLLEDFLSGRTLPQELKEQGAIYWRKRSAADSLINWHLSARKVFLLIRALARAPIYAYSQYNSYKFTFTHVEVADDAYTTQLPGTVISEGEEILICCGDRKAVRVVAYNAPEGGLPLREGMVLH
jgi:methionyl-tRNA formyltransferase